MRARRLDLRSVPHHWELLREGRRPQRKMRWRTRRALQSWEQRQFLPWRWRLPRPKLAPVRIRRRYQRAANAGDHRRSGAGLQSRKDRWRESARRDFRMCGTHAFRIRLRLVSCHLDGWRWRGHGRLAAIFRERFSREEDRLFGRGGTGTCRRIFEARAIRAATVVTAIFVTTRRAARIVAAAITSAVGAAIIATTLVVRAVVMAAIVVTARVVAARIALRRRILRRRKVAARGPVRAATTIATATAAPTASATVVLAVTLTAAVASTIRATVRTAIGARRGILLRRIVMRRKILRSGRVGFGLALVVEGRLRSIVGRGARSFGIFVAGQGLAGDCGVLVVGVRIL